MNFPMRSTIAELLATMDAVHWLFSCQNPSIFGLVYHLPGEAIWVFLFPIE